MVEKWITQLWQTRTKAVFLLPFSAIYLGIIMIRRWLYRHHFLKQYQAPVPVIVIGNIRVGGTGKTPLTLYLANALQKQGFHPGIISRGYKATLTSPLEVTTDSNPNTCPDEALLMAQHTSAPIFVHKKRKLAIQALLKTYPHCDVILSDDGLQHYALHRDIEIALIPTHHTDNGFLLPAGPLRELKSRLNTVDFIVSPQKSVAKNQAPTQFAPCRISMQLIPQKFYQLTHPDNIKSADTFIKEDCHAIAGIANPERFFHSLAKMGIHCPNTPFNDHHQFIAKDLPSNAIILATEKDAVKLQALKDDRIWILPIKVALEPDLTPFIVAKLTTLKIDYHG